MSELAAQAEPEKAALQGSGQQASSRASEPLAQIENGTARRIGIRPKDEHSTLSPLVISPFGLRQIKKKDLDKYDYETWVSLNLIQFPKVETEPSSDWIYAAPGCALLLGIPILFIGLFVPTFSGSDLFRLVVSLLVLIGIVPPLIAWLRSGKASGKLTPVVNASSKALVILGILLVGVGCPLVTAGYFAMGIQSVSLDTSLRETLTAAVFGRTLQIVFIIIASTLPGLLYFIFERQKYDTVRLSLHQQIVLLDPNVPTTFDAKQKYSPLIDAVYGVKGAAHYLGTGGWSLIISTILLTLGWITVLFPVVPKQDMVLGNLPELFAPSPSVWTFGFLGAYFFALNMVFKRYVRSDLTAKAYTHISVRILITATLAWVLNVIQLVFLGSAESPARILSATAFLVGVIPETGTTYLQELLRRARFRSPSIAEADPLTNLEGVNIYDRARLSEEGVDNVENVAHHNLIELLIRTRIPAPRLVDIVDQAILYLHAGDGSIKKIVVEDSGQNAQAKKSERELTLQFLRSYGIRTATDLERACGVAGDYGDVAVEGPAKEGILFKSLKGDQKDRYEARLRVILEALHDDEWILQLRHWRREGTRIETIVVKPEEFFGQYPPVTFHALPRLI